MTSARPAFRARERPERPADPLDPERPPVDDRVEARVLVLVDDDDAHGRVVLPLERVEEAARARPCGPPSRRRGRTTEARCDTRRRLRDVRAERPARHRAPCRPRRRAVRPGCARERPRTDALGPRAARRRRRVQRRHARHPRGLEDSRVRVLRNDEQRRSRGVAEPRPRRGARRVRRPNRRRRRRHAATARAAARSDPVDSRGRGRGLGRPGLDAGWRLGPLHAMPVGSTEVRWAALFSSPFFHPTRSRRARRPRDDTGCATTRSFEESEDYELWSRLLEVAEGDNVPSRSSSIASIREQASHRRSAPARVPAPCRATAHR